MLTNNSDFDSMVAFMNARFEAMRLEREATDAVFQERLSALEEKELAANVDRLITNICMLVNTTRRFL